MGVKKVRLKTAGPCFGDHIIPYHKAKMLYLSNMEKKIFRIAGALKLHFFGFSVLTKSDWQPAARVFTITFTGARKTFIGM